MGEQDRALHEIADARARLSELADELARKAEPERLKAMAHDKAEELKVRAKEFATHKKDELKQHAKDAAVEKATELKTQAKETVMQRTMELKERADTPKGWSLLGALLGAGVGSALMRKAFTKREEQRWSSDRYDTRYDRHGESRWREDDRWRYDGLRSSGRTDVGDSRDVGYSSDDRYATADRPDIGYGAGTSYGGVSYDEASSRDIGATSVDDTGDSGGGLKARASETAHNVRDRASGAAQSVKERAVDVKDRVAGKTSEVRERAAGAVDHLRERASHLRERIPERQAVRARTTDWFNRTLEEQPLLLALGGIALGMVASTLIPVSNKERQLIEPAKRRAEEGISQLGDQLNQKLGVNEQSSDMDDRQDFSSASNMSATSDLNTTASASTVDTGFGATSLSGPGNTGTSYGATSATPTGAPVVDNNADNLASSPSGSSRIPPLPPLDDLTKVH